MSQTGGEFDVEYPHALVFPWRRVFSAPPACPAQVICGKKVLEDGVHNACH